jgi:hypothetical protein
MANSLIKKFNICRKLLIHYFAFFSILVTKLQVGTVLPLANCQLSVSQICFKVKEIYS